MARRGKIVIECDTPDCYAEIVLPAHEEDVINMKWGVSIEFCASGWQHRDRKDTCPQCSEEGK